VYTYMYEYS